jgi:hypothetical protein
MKKISFALKRKYVVVERKRTKIDKQYRTFQNKLNSQDEISENEFNKMVAIRKRMYKIYNQLMMIKTKISCEYFENLDIHASYKENYKHKLKFLAETPKQSL